MAELKVRSDCRSPQSNPRLVCSFVCGCTTRCLYPSVKKVAAARAKNFAPFICDRKVYWMSAGSSFEIHGDGTQIHKVYDMNKPTKITTIRPGRKAKVTYGKDR